MYIADRLNNCIRKVTVSTGIITTVAGTGTTGYSGDNGAAISATMDSPIGVAIDSSGTQGYSPIFPFRTLFLHVAILSTGNVYVADCNNHRIRKVTISTGIITTIAGTGTGSYSGDNGPATSATLCSPVGVALDSAGTTFILFY